MRSSGNISILGLMGGALLAASGGRALASFAPSTLWETPAQWHRILEKSVPGTLVLDEQGLEFRSAKFNQRWTYVDIQSFDLSATELTLVGYQNRPWHEPGERTFHFTWSDSMPPEIAARFTAFVGKPVRNGIPLPSVAALSEIPAHHRMWSGGSNGTLRLKDTGIDYVTENGRDSRTWRWADVQTIANPNPYELRVTGYRETVEFDLKEPLSRATFEQIWDRLYSADLSLSAVEGGHHQ